MIGSRIHCSVSVQQVAEYTSPTITNTQPSQSNAVCPVTCVVRCCGGSGGYLYRGNSLAVQWWAQSSLFQVRFKYRRKKMIHAPKSLQPDLSRNLWSSISQLFLGSESNKCSPFPCLHDAQPQRYNSSLQGCWLSHCSGLNGLGCPKIEKNTPK